MKHFFSGMLIGLAFVLAIVMGLAAIAETAAPEGAQPPAVEEAPSAAVPAAPDAATDSTTSDSAALQDALNAYNAARQSDRTEALETELSGYVASGKLTQEQADLILNYYKERDALRNGTCPNCGYQFKNDGGFGKGGRMNGGKGNRGGNGGMRGFDRQPTDGQGAPQTNGAAWEGDWQIMPNTSELDNI